MEQKGRERQVAALRYALSVQNAGNVEQGSEHTAMCFRMYPWPVEDGQHVPENHWKKSSVPGICPRSV